MTDHTDDNETRKLTTSPLEDAVPTRPIPRAKEEELKEEVFRPPDSAFIPISPQLIDDYREPDAGDQDLDLDTQVHVESEILGQIPRRSILPWALGIAVLIAVFVGIFYLLKAEPEKPDAAAFTPPPAESSEPAVEQEPAEVFGPLPARANSDDYLRDLLGGDLTEEKVKRWFSGTELVRRLVTSIDNVAEGQSPRRHLEAFRPSQGFSAEPRGNRWIMGSSSFVRYNSLVHSFDSMDRERNWKIYSTIRPWIEDAYRQLGYPQRDFDQTCITAIDHLLATPIPTDPVFVEKKITTWIYSDSRFENLSDAQKHLLRMGPGNQRRVQSALRWYRGRLAD